MAQKMLMKRDKNVAVSDQVNVVTTNENGFYRIQYTSIYGILFVSLPNGFQSKAWWQRVDSINNVSQINFPLVKIASPSSFYIYPRVRYSHQRNKS